MQLNHALFRDFPQEFVQPFSGGCISSTRRARSPKMSPFVHQNVTIFAYANLLPAPSQPLTTSAPQNGDIFSSREGDETYDQNS